MAQLLWRIAPHSLPISQRDGALTPHLRRKQRFMALLAACWLVGSGWLLFSLQTQDQQLFDPSLLRDDDTFSASQLADSIAATLGTHNKPLLIHAWDANCPCSAATIDHLKQLKPLIARSGARVLLTANGMDLAGTVQAAQNLSAATGIEFEAIEFPLSLVPSSPAAVLVDAQGKLVYWGPYAAGGACVSGSGGFVESALASLDQDQTETLINRTTVGCYCTWQNTALTNSQL